MKFASEDLISIEVLKIKSGAVNAQVNACVQAGAEIHITLTLEALQKLGIVEGMRAYAIVGESNHPILTKTKG